MRREGFAPCYSVLAVVALFRRVLVLGAGAAAGVAGVLRKARILAFNRSSWRFRIRRISF